MTISKIRCDIVNAFYFNYAMEFKGQIEKREAMD